MLITLSSKDKICHWQCTSIAGSFKESNGSLSATIGIRYVMELPVKGYEAKGGIKGESRRSEEEVPLSIVS